MVSPSCCVDAHAGRRGTERPGWGGRCAVSDRAGPGRPGVGFVPGMPPAGLPPDLVLVLFLPPLLFQEASSFSPRELRANARPIALLAAELDLPLTTSTSQPFPHRHLIIFLTFGVILATMVLQGLTLPWLIRRLGLHRDDSETQESWGGACGPPTRGWPGWRSWPPRTGPAMTPSSRCGGCTSSAASAWSASCWRPSTARSCCSAPGRDQQRGHAPHRARPRPGGLPARDLEDP